MCLTAQTLLLRFADLDGAHGALRLGFGGVDLAAVADDDRRGCGGTFFNDRAAFGAGILHDIESSLRGGWNDEHR